MKLKAAPLSQALILHIKPEQLHLTQIKVQQHLI